MENLRLKKLASQFRQEVAGILVRDIEDSHLREATVNHVILTADLHIARIYFTHPSGKEGEKKIVRAFKKSRGFLRSQLAKLIRLKFTPELEFYFDDTEEHFRKVEGLFYQIDEEKKSKIPH